MSTGLSPTVTVATTAFVLVSITEMEFERAFAT